MRTMTRPTFLKSLLDSWQLTLAHGKQTDLLPYWLGLSLAAGAAVSLYLPANFWNGEKLDVAVSLLSGLLTFNGIILALCWSAFGKIFEVIGAGRFCDHLRANNLLGHYLMFVSYCQLVQVAAIVCTAFAMFSLWLPVAAWVSKVAVTASVGFSLYALKQGVATSSVMQDLIWQKSEFDVKQPRPVSGLEQAR